MMHPSDCPCRLCGSFVVGIGQPVREPIPTVQEVAALLSDVGTLVRLPSELEGRVRNTLRRLMAG